MLLSGLITRRALGTISVSTLVLSTAAAWAESATDDSGLFPEDERVLEFGTQDRNLTVAPFVQLDAGAFDLDPGRSDYDADVTLARLYLFAAYDKFDATLAFDLQDSFVYRYAFASYQASDRLRWRLGQQDEPFSLQDVSGSRFLPFASAGLSSTLIPGDNVGIAFSYGGDAWSISAGLFGGDLNDGIDARGSAITARVTWAPIYAEEEIRRGGDATRTGVGTQRVVDLLHLGAAISIRYDLGQTVSFSGGTGSSLPDVSLATSPSMGNIDRLTRVNIEAARSIGSLSIQGEWTAARVESANRDGVAHGGYLYATYFLTGERRGYDRSSGTFGRVVPIRPVGSGGIGAVEVGLRAEYLDLTDLGPDAGRQIGVSAVTNLYMTKRLRLTADYSRELGTGGTIDGTSSNAITARVQFAY